MLYLSSTLIFFNALALAIFHKLFFCLRCMIQHNIQRATTPKFKSFTRTSRHHLNLELTLCHEPIRQHVRDPSVVCRGGYTENQISRGLFMGLEQG